MSGESQEKESSLKELLGIGANFINHKDSYGTDEDRIQVIANLLYH